MLDDDDDGVKKFEILMFKLRWGVFSKFMDA